MLKLFMLILTFLTQSSLEPVIINTYTVLKMELRNTLFNSLYLPYQIYFIISKQAGVPKFKSSLGIYELLKIIINYLRKS